MDTKHKDFAPYFRNGLLYLPEKTVTLLTEAGLDPGIGRMALKGLSLDDQRQQIALISQTLEMVLEKLAEDTQAFQALSSDDTHFLLTGKPASV